MRFAHRVLFLGLSTLGLVPMVSAQNIHLNVFGGYTFQDRFNSSGTYYNYTYSEARIDESSHFGGSIEFEMRPNKSIELLYQNQSTNGWFMGPVQDFGPYKININYIMLGGLGYAPFSQAVKGYGGLNVGCAYMTGDASATKFAWGGRLGLMINFSETVGLKLGGQLLSPVQGAGGGFYFVTGGASAGVSTYSSIYQFGVTGGLCFTPRRGGHSPAPKAPSAPPASSTPPPGYPPGQVPPPPPPPPPGR